MHMLVCARPIARQQFPDPGVLTFFATTLCLMPSMWPCM